MIGTAARPAWRGVSGFTLGVLAAFTIRGMIGAPVPGFALQLATYCGIVGCGFGAARQARASGLAGGIGAGLAAVVLVQV